MPGAWVRDQRVFDLDQALTPRSADAVQQQVHRGKACGSVDQLGAVDEGVAQVLTLGRGELLGVPGGEIVCSQEESSRSRSRVDHGSRIVGRTQSTIAWMSGRGVKYWPAPDLMSSAPLDSSSS